MLIKMLSIGVNSKAIPECINDLLGAVIPTVRSIRKIHFVIESHELLLIMLHLKLSKEHWKDRYFVEFAEQYCTFVSFRINRITKFI